MSIDPTDPETFEDEATTTELDVEAPEADAAEQLADVSRRYDDPLTSADPGVASEADLAEQARVVDLDDEDEYR
ncbi:hypothetical protein [Streptomyces sp. NPDC003077]|uniref:hypothetical protein n=1 Tax=Streptomyces sp. NPDC003077 TaxID=3154443 RepID=UPI0033A2B5D2